jgi:hypothetical protein
MERSRFVDYKFNEPNCIVFWLNGREIGKLLFEEEEVRFEGDADDSAKIFFNQYVKPLVDGYFKEKLELFN